MNPGLIKNYIAQGVVAPYRAVAHGTIDGHVVQAASAVALIVGVTGQLGAAIGERLDVQLSGQVEIELGGVVARGQPIVADANGMAVEAAPVSGSNVRLIGFASVSGVSGDIIDVDIAPGVMQG